MESIPQDIDGLLLAVIGVLVTQIIAMIRDSYLKKTQHGPADYVSKGEWAAFKQEWGAHRIQSVETAKLTDKIHSAIDRLEHLHQDSDSKFSTVNVLKELRELKEEVNRIESLLHSMERKRRNGGG